MTKDNEISFISFDSIWKWILEVIYKTSDSRYDWMDFKNKAII